MSEIYYCIPDIHGCYELLKKALDYIYKEHPNGCKIIFLGDYIDRGSKNKAVLETVMYDHPNQYEFICLKGNHEAAFVDSYYSKMRFMDPNVVFEYCTDDVKEMNSDNYLELHAQIPENIIRWMDNLPFFYIQDKNVFAHAFYDDTLLPQNQIENVCIWDRMSDSEKYWNDNQGFFLTHGHTPRQTGPKFAQNRVNLDAGAVFYGRLVIGKYKKNVQGPIDIFEFKEGY